MTFEQQVKRLEEIVEIIDNEKTSLDDASKLFTEGVELCKNCFKTLNESKRKINVLQEELGKLVEKPLE